MIERIANTGGPKAQGPYSPAVRAGNLLYISGQGPINPLTNEFILGKIEDQTRLVIENLSSVLTSCGSSLTEVVKCSVYLNNSQDFAAMNQVYAEYFGANKPARTTVVTALVVPEMKIEIDCIAWSPEGMNRAVSS